MTTDEKRETLLNVGFTVGTRDPRVNTNYSGDFMVIEPHEECELPTQDGRDGPWAVVGDDLPLLIDLAYDFAFDTYLASRL